MQKLILSLIVMSSTNALFAGQCFSGPTNKDNQKKIAPFIATERKRSTGVIKDSGKSKESINVDKPIHKISSLQTSDSEKRLAALKKKKEEEQKHTDFMNLVVLNQVIQESQPQHHNSGNHCHKPVEHHTSNCSGNSHHTQNHHNQDSGYSSSHSHHGDSGSSHSNHDYSSGSHDYSSHTYDSGSSGW